MSALIDPHDGARDLDADGSPAHTVLAARWSDPHEEPHHGLRRVITDAYLVERYREFGGEDYSENGYSVTFDGDTVLEEVRGG